jgi:hypothetical protein
LISISFSLLDAENVYTDIYTPSLRFLETRQKAGQHGLISSFDFGDEIMPNHGAWEARTMEVSLEPLQHPLAGPDAGAPSRLSERAPHVRQDLFALSL